MKLILIDGKTEQEVTNIVRTSNGVRVKGATLSASFPIPGWELSKCEGDHAWGVWYQFTSDRTTYAKGLYTTSSTPTQSRRCVNCNFEEQAVIERKN